jgi:hypothetical protein
MVMQKATQKRKKTGGGKPRPYGVVFRRRQRVERLMLDGFTEREVLAKILEEFPGTGEGTVGKDCGLVMHRWLEAAEVTPERRAAALAGLRDHVLAAREDKAYSAVAALERVRRAIEGTLPVGGLNAPSVAVQVNVANQVQQDSVPSLDLWPDHLFERARPLLEQLNALGVEAAAWVRSQGGGGPPPALPSPGT